MADEITEPHVVRKLEKKTAEIIHSEERSNIRVIGSPSRKKTGQKTILKK